jgi:hypothetical protein
MLRPIGLRQPTAYDERNFAEIIFIFCGIVFVGRRACGPLVFKYIWNGISNQE